MNGKFNFHCEPKTDGRLYTAITNFPSILRPFLRYDQKILGEVDLSSSVPFFLYCILKSVLENKIEEIQSRKVNSNLFTYMLGKTVVTLDITEVEHFGKIIKENKLYDTLMDEFLDIHLFDTSLKPDEYLLVNFEEIFKRPFDGDVDDLRKFAKMRILSMFFARPDAFIHEQAIFQKHFQTIHLYLKKYKQHKLKGINNIDQHKKLAHLGFQLESDLMLNHIARDFNNLYKREKIIMSLHDCLITTKENVPLLESFMRDKFIEQLGFAPNLKVKYWEEEETVIPLLPFANNKLSA